MQKDHEFKSAISQGKDLLGFLVSIGEDIKEELKAVLDFHSMKIAEMEV